MKRNQMISLVALQDQNFHGQQIGKGDVFRASAIEAASLRYLKKADFAPPEKRTLRTQTVKAEPAAEPQEPSTQPTAPADEPDAPRRRRQYRRRDLVPEP